MIETDILPNKNMRKKLNKKSLIKKFPGFIYLPVKFSWRRSALFTRALKICLSLEGIKSKTRKIRTILGGPVSAGPDWVPLSGGISPFFLYHRGFIGPCLFSEVAPLTGFYDEIFFLAKSALTLVVYEPPKCRNLWSSSHISFDFKDIGSCSAIFLEQAIKLGYYFQQLLDF